MKKLALIGEDVSFSQSPKIHSFLLSKMGETCSFELVSTREFPKEVSRLFKETDAFNVTSPYKEKILPFLSALSDRAKSAKSVNTVISSEKFGDTTDGEGLALSLQEEIRGKDALLLGAGGAARSVLEALLRLGAKVDVFARRKESLEEISALFPKAAPLESIPLKEYDILINCTGAESLPEVRFESFATFETLFSLSRLAVDLRYEPKKSRFLQEAEKRNCRILNGEGMLFFQAYLADCLFLNRKSDAAEANFYYMNYLEDA